MNEISGILMGVVGGLVAGLALGLCFVWLLGCTDLEMQMITIVHATLAMIVMGAWVMPALLPPS